MTEPQHDAFADLVASWWLLAAVAVSLPVCVVVFRRIGRWWISNRPVPLPLDRAWPAVPWPVWFGLLLFLGMELLLYGVAIGYDVAADAGLLPWEPLPVDPIFSPGVFLAQIVPAIVGLAVLACVDRRALASAGVRLGSVFSGVLHGVGAFAAILPVCVAALLVSATVAGLLDYQVTPHPLLRLVKDSRESWMIGAAFVQAVVLAPLAEEFLYRGVLMQTLLKQVGVAGALVVSSAVFAVVHFAAEPQAVLPLFFLAMALGYVTHRTRSLVAAVVAHALFNALMVTGTILGG